MTETMFESLRGKIALVTGASSGIGAALALRLGQLGSKVVCSARGRHDLDAVVARIAGAGGSALSVPADGTDADQMAALGRVVDREFGGLDLAFLNAGGNVQQASLVDSDVGDWRAALDLNVLPVFLGIQTVVPLMRKRGGGRIIYTGSAMAHYPSRNNASYCAGKAAARIVAKTAALELVDDNITVNEFIPGPVRTRQTQANYDPADPNSPFNNPAEWVKDPEDVTEMLVFLAAYPGKGPNSQVYSLARR